ncbi:unnamed protein product [Phytomonas sp. EM1]|nr:unnamed protein product [Phytomonas sp. EM1]|eukprot:CCW61905.1 unnamed protein product [Phytomonas sp. isolate EM1]
MDVSLGEEPNALELPEPMLTSLECAVSPIHHLLLSYPVPELVVPTRIASLPPPNGEHRQDGMRNNRKYSEIEPQTRSAFSGEAANPGRSDNKEDLWDQKEVQMLAQNMQTSITDLLRSGQCTQFLQEEFHSESCAAASSTSMATTAATPKQGDKSTDCLPTAAAVSYLDKQTTESLMTQLSSEARRTTTISRPSSIKDTQSSSWTSSSRMTLRPRKTSLPSEQQHEQTSPEPKKPDQIFKKEDSPPPEQDASPILETEIASKGILADMLASVNTLSKDVSGFLSFAYAPTLALDSFKEVPAEELSGLVSALVTDSQTEDLRGMKEKEDPSSCQRDWLRTARALCCITLVSCPAFDVRLIPDGTVDQLITIFAGVVRYVTAELSCPAYENKVTRGRGTKGSTATGILRSISQDMPNELNTSSRQHFAPPKTMLKWIEALRLFLQRFAPVVCNRTLDLVLDTNLVRLEDFVYHLLFVAPHRSVTRDAYLWYTSYIGDCALHTYRCLWNRLETQRATTARRFFSRLPLSNYLTFRTLTCANGKKLLPLTVAVLSAAQSVPIDTDTTDSGLAMCLKSQCDLWVECLLRQLIFEHEKDEKPLQTITWNILTLFLEDLVELIGAPEWPAADMLLRSCVLSLIKVFFENNVRRQSSKTAKAASMRTTHATAAVDVIAEVTLKLFHPSISGLTLMSSLPQSQRLQEEESLNVMMNEALLQYWADATRESVTEGKPVQKRGNSGLSRHKHRSVNSSDRKVDGLDADESGAAATGNLNREHVLRTDESRVLSLTDQARRLIYYALSHYAETTSAADEASLWFHARAAHVLGWHLNNPTSLPASALDRLVRAKAVPSAGVRVDLSELHHWGRMLCAQEDESMLSAKSRLMLVSVLLNLLYIKDDHGQETLIVSDTVAKRSLHHLSRIAEMCPSVCRLMWPITRRCVRESSTIVRELSVPLLLGLLRSVTSPSGGVSALPMEEANLAADVISSLLHLLEDSSVTVVSRTIAALGTVITNRLYVSLLESAQGKEFLGFIQYKLLLKAKDVKHSAEVTKLFFKRWVLGSLETEDEIAFTAMSMMPHIRLTAELLDLVRQSSHEYPYEVQDDNPLINLLSGFRQLETTAPRLEPAELTQITQQQQKSGEVDVQHIMCNVARSLWNQQQSADTAEESVLCMAALRVLAVVANEWVEPLMDAILSGLEYPFTATPPSSQDQQSKRGKEWLGGVLLQTCQITKAVLSSSKVPTISLEHLARALTKLLSKYTGPYQQRIITSSCGALASMITCGAKHKLSSHINQTYLRICYSLMNLYYMRVKGLLPELANQPQNIAYTQRFLFLLSELLRSYPGWRTPHPVLYQDAATSSGADAVPNMLIKGGGICENIYELVVAVRTQCGEDARPRLNVITLRVLAALCMLQPVDFLHRCEAYVMEALADLNDVAHQTQGFTFIVDFLADEDARVECAARMAAKMSSGGSVLSDRESDKSDEEGGVHVKSRSRPPPRGIKRTRSAMATAHDALSLPEQSSGMATWVMQRFHTHVIERCKSQHVSIRKLCLDILELTARGGLLPPVKYLHAVVALAADVNLSLRQRSGQFLLTHRDQHENIITSIASRGIELAYDIQHLCGANLIHNATTSSSDATVVQSIHAPLFTLLRKPSRDGLIASLLRYFYDESKAEAWVSEHDNKAWGGPIEDVFRASNPVTFLGHLAVVIATRPFSSEGDIVYLVQRCRTGIDLHGESALDQISSLLKKYREMGNGSIQGGDIEQPLMNIVSLWKCVGVVLLMYIHRAVRTEYRQRSFKLNNSTQQGNLAHTPLHQHDRKNNTTSAFLPSVETLVHHACTLLHVCGESDDVQRYNEDASNGKEEGKSESVLLISSSKETEEALAFLRQELESGLLEEGIGGVERGCGTTKSAGASQRCLKKRMGTATGMLRRRVSRRKESLSTQSDSHDSSHSTCSSSSVSEGDGDIAEEDTETASSSVSASTATECDT